MSDDREFDSAARDLVEALAGDGNGSVRPGITWSTLVWGDNGVAYDVTVQQIAEGG